jgi:DNA polymerase III subunit delta
MTPEQAMEQAKSDTLRPVYLVMGDEGLLVEQVVKAVRAAVTAGGVAGFNDDRFIAAESSIDAVLGAARTAPMMAKRRYVHVSSLERWEAKSGEALDALAAYAADPMPTTVMVLTAEKLHGSRRLVRAAKKEGFVVDCTPLGKRELPGWIRRAATAKGHELAPGIADLLAELLGPELGPVADALERLSLYVGEGKRIDEAAVGAVVTRVRQETVWGIVDALATRDFAAALSALDDAYEWRDGGLPLLGAITWRVRQLLKFDAALGRGLGAKVAAQNAGVAPFKAGELERGVRRIGRDRLERWLMLLAEADLALKGSRRAGLEVLATMLAEMCRG